MIAPLLFLLQWDVDDLVFQLEHKGLKEPIVYKADNRNAAERYNFG